NAHIDIQLSRLIGTGNMVLKNSSGITVGSTSNSGSDQRIQFDDIFSADDFTLSVRADQSQFAPAAAYTLAITTDRAPGALIPGTSSRDATKFRELGTLKETSHTQATDFVGYLDTSNRTAKDLIDTYGFNVPAPGQVTVELGGITQDPADAFAAVKAD